MAKFDIDVLRERIPQDRAEFFIGFSPWPEDFMDWRQSVDEDHAESPERRLSRTVWDHPEDRQSRIMIDIRELSSAAQAVDVLAESLEGNQLDELPEGPSGLGYVSFVHPEGAPPAAFLVRGNLMIAVFSLGTTALDVVDWTTRMINRLRERPDEARKAIRLDIGKAELRTGVSAPLSYTLPWEPGQHGFVKVFVDGGRLAREDGTLSVIPGRAGPIDIDVLAVESGREALTGHLSVTSG